MMLQAMERKALAMAAATQAEGDKGAAGMQRAVAVMSPRATVVKSASARGFEVDQAATAAGWIVVAQ